MATCPASSPHHDLFARILELWGMPLFFVVAAIAIYFSLTTRDNRHFLAERFKAKFLLIALVSFVIIIGLYEGVIVRVPFLRFVLGMKAISSTTRTPS